MQSVAVIVPGPLILPCFFPPRVSGVGFGRIDDLCWLGAVLRNLDGSIVLTVGFWVLGAIYIGGTKKSSSSRCVAGGDRCSSYFGEASVPVCWMPSSALVCFEVCLWFTFESVLITRITCVVRYDHSLGLIFD